MDDETGNRLYGNGASPLVLTFLTDEVMAMSPWQGHVLSKQQQPAQNIPGLVMPGVRGSFVFDFAS